MKSQVSYIIEPDDQNIVRRINEDLNMVIFVFSRHPELMPVKGESHPHRLVMDGNPFTMPQFNAWTLWVDRVITAGYECFRQQPEAYQEGHRMALRRLREDTNEFIDTLGNLVGVQS